MPIFVFLNTTNSTTTKLSPASEMEANWLCVHQISEHDGTVYVALWECCWDTQENAGSLFL